MKNSSYFILLFIFLGLGFLFFDFSPRVYKEILKVQNLITNQKYKEAIQSYENILKKNPKKEIEIRVLYQLGDLYSIYLNESEKSLKYYKRIIEISEDPLWLVRTEEKIAEIYFNYLKDNKKALEIYKRLKGFKPKLKGQDFYHFRYSRCLFRLNYFSKSQKSFEEIKDNEKHEYHVRSYYFLGLIHFQTKRWKKAIFYWKEYLRKETRSDNIAQTKFLMANTYETMEQFKKAYNLYYSILGEYPNTKVIQDRLNSIYNRKVARKR